MRYAHVIDHLELGGAQRLEVTFAEEVRRRGHEFLIASLGSQRDDRVVKALEDAGAEVVGLGQRWRPPVGPAVAIPALARLLLRRRPAAVQTHLTYANVVGTVAARVARVPCVATLHNTNVDTAHHRRSLLALEGFVLRSLTGGVVAVGPAVAAGQQWRLGRRTPLIVPNAVGSPARLSAGERSRLRTEVLGHDGGLLLLAVGRLTEQKGYEDLLAAFRSVADRHPSAVLAVAGQGDLGGALRERARADGLGDRVRFLGARGDVQRLLAACDLYVAASRWEGLPLAVLEAMAAGAPVVATAVGDVPTVVTDGTGMLVPAEQPAALAEAVCAMLDDPERRRRMGAAAADRAAAEYGAQRWVDRLLAAYETARVGDRSSRVVRAGDHHGPRVAVLIHGYHPRVGGAEKQMGAVAPLLTARGVDVHVITRRTRGLPALELVDGVPVHRVPAPGPPPVASLVYTATALLVLRRLRPQVLHAHEFISPATTALFAKRLLGPPTAVTAHRSGALGDVALLRARRSGPRRLESLRRHVDAFVVISTDIGEELAGIGVPAHRQVHVPNGVDVERFRPAADGEQQRLRTELGLPEGPLALFAGRLAPEKRVAQLLGVWDGVRDAVPGATLAVLGTGQEETALRQQAGDGVVFGGAVGDVAPWLRAADVFVLPSIAEGLSVAMLEAMATGLPALVTDVGGARDVIHPGEDGWIVPPDDVPALREALRTLLADPALRRRVGDRARVRVEDSYSLRAAADRLDALYRRMAGTAGGG